MKAGVTKKAVDIMLDYLQEPIHAWAIMRNAHPGVFRTPDEGHI